MSTKPILFSGPMVRAILEGRKSQTRRVLKLKPGMAPWQDEDTGEWFQSGHGEAGDDFLKVPYAPGDLLWVRESFRLRADQNEKRPSDDWWKSGAWYHADDPELVPSGCGGGAGKLRPSIHMPRWASRLTLEVTAIKVQRVQDISCADALAEGVTWPDSEMEAKGEPSGSPIIAFEELWNGLNEGRGYDWEANPWVVAVTFKAHHCNVDSMEKQP
ncbi:hypothetical protein HBA54_28085 [Pelagibius litoralis]|uniref:Uncharacterized protein n=1 Tax=Pelagibius litoralis TaxID=374515 RepID=A0A967F3P5_9PROT|nr:hypothetical protein [Pelagibius litoralis]NIA72452.1 hypothetical protein [Pelagibius litoralis]